MGRPRHQQRDEALGLPTRRMTERHRLGAGRMVPSRERAHRSRQRRARTRAVAGQAAALESNHASNIFGDAMARIQCARAWRARDFIFISNGRHGYLMRAGDESHAPRGMYAACRGRRGVVGLGEKRWGARTHRHTRLVYQLYMWPQFSGKRTRC